MMRGTVQRPVGQRAGSERASSKSGNSKVPTLEDLVNDRDFLGAITLLHFKKAAEQTGKTQEWLAYCYFHAGQYDKALQVYETLLNEEDVDPDFYVYAALCHFYLGNYSKAQVTAKKGPKSLLQNRLLFHCAHAVGDENLLVQHHSKITQGLEDQLSLAAIHFRRSHFQEATDIYKRILVEHKDFAALNIYIALCYSRLDYYDVSQDILKQYLSQHPTSLMAMNLNTCNIFRLHDGARAEAELQNFKANTAAALQDNDIVRHNLVVFRKGENAARDLAPLVGILPEARLNLVIYHLRKGDLEAAFDLIKDVEPSQPQEYILTGVVHAALGQSKNDSEHLKNAQQYFQLVGASASECDTIPGRQCMASCFFLLKQFDDVLIFLSSIQQYFADDDDFNWNLGIALASCSKWQEAEDSLLAVKSEAYRKQYCYCSWLARCHIMNAKPQLAWKLYLQAEMSDDSYKLLHVIANDCYTMGHFLYSAKAFQVLERLDPDEKYFDGKRGACCGYIQAVFAGKDKGDSIVEVIGIMRDSGNRQAADIAGQMESFALSRGIAVQ